MNTSVRTPASSVVRLRYLPSTTPVAVGQLYRWCWAGNLVVITEILDEFHVLVKSHGYHIYGRIRPSTNPRTTKLRHNGTGVLIPLKAIRTNWFPVSIKCPSDPTCSRPSGASCQTSRAKG